MGEREACRRVDRDGALVMSAGRRVEEKGRLLLVWNCLWVAVQSGPAPATEPELACDGRACDNILLEDVVIRLVIIFSRGCMWLLIHRSLNVAGKMCEVRDGRLFVISNLSPLFADKREKICSAGTASWAPPCRCRRRFFQLLSLSLSPDYCMVGPHPCSRFYVRQGYFSYQFCLFKRLSNY